MPQTPTPFWNADYAGQEGASVGYIELLPFSGSKAGTGPFRVDTSGNVTARSISPAVGIGLAPTNDTSGVQDLANIMGLVNLGLPVQLLADTTYYINGDIHPPAGGMVIRGGGGYDQAAYPGQGTVIKAAAGYSGTAMINVTAIGHALTPGPDLRDFALDGSSIGTVDGVRGTGPVSGGVMENVFIANTGGVGWNNVVDNSATGQKFPYGWHVYHLKITAHGAQGIICGNHTDATWVDVHTLGNNAHSSSHGISINGPMPNSRLIGCKAEWPGTGKDAWHLTGAWGTGTASGGLTMVGCSSDRGDNNGFFCSATGTVPLILSGCMFRRDGRNGGSGGGGFAGINLTGSTIPIIISGPSVFPGVDDDGTQSNSPQYGLKIGNNTANVSVTSGYYQGDTAGLAPFGTGTSNIYISPNAIFASGTTSSPTLTNSPLSAAVAAEVDVANTGTETTIVSLTLPGGMLAAGSTYRITLQGTVQVKATSGTLTFRPYIGGTVAPETLQMGSQGSAAGPVGFWAEMYATVRTTGASGTYIAHGHGEIELGTRVNLITAGTTTATVDTTVAAPVVKLTAQWATADPANSLTVTVATIERVN